MTLENMLLEPTLNTVKGLMIMDNNGVRILSKYYDPEIFPNVAAEKKFEKTLFQKTHKVCCWKTERSGKELRTFLYLEI